MLPKLCVHCNKRSSRKSGLNRHTKTVRNRYVQPPVDDSLRQNGGSHGDNDVQSTPQTKFENDDKLRDLNDFWQLEMSKQMTEWNSVKLRKYTPSVFYILTLTSRALSRDNILKSIMKTAKHFRDTRGLWDYEAVGCAVSEKQSEICDKHELSVKEPESSDSELETGIWELNTDFDWTFDIWEFINNILDGENFDSENSLCGHARTKRGVELIFFIRETLKPGVVTTYTEL